MGIWPRLLRHCFTALPFHLEAPCLANHVVAVKSQRLLKREFSHVPEEFRWGFLGDGQHPSVGDCRWAPQAGQAPFDGRVQVFRFRDLVDQQPGVRFARPDPASSQDDLAGQPRSGPPG